MEVAWKWHGSGMEVAWKTLVAATPLRRTTFCESFESFCETHSHRLQL